MSKHTPGPWINVKTVVLAKPKSDKHSGTKVAEAMFSDEPSEHYVDDKEEAEANARLISAAPELLAVLKELEESTGYWSEYDVPLGIVDRIRAALAKAEA